MNATDLPAVLKFSAIYYSHDTRIRKTPTQTHAIKYAFTLYTVLHLSVVIGQRA